MATRPNLDWIYGKTPDLVRIVYNFDKLSLAIELWQSAYYNLVKRGLNHAKERAYFNL
jgi:hypothetical protein